MPKKDLNRFFFSIVFPSILAITLFMLSIFVVILPSFEKSIMNDKKEMISELTNTARSLLEEYHTEYKNGNFSLKEAQKKAASRIERMRYGKSGKDYFWIIDQHPNMIMHPYRGELIETDLSDYQDPNGVKLFVKAVEVVKENGEGYIDYMWQWKDDSTKIVPKLSYVRGFKNWGWIIGTGIYLEDVKEEIKALKTSLLTVSFIITFLIIVILLFGIRQSLTIENKRKDAEGKLLQSQQRYKSLVEASTSGTLMIVNQNIIYSNIKFSKLIGYGVEEVMELSFEDIFMASWEQLKTSFTDPKKTISLETQLKCHDNTKKEVIISASKIKQANDDGYIIITKEISRQKQIEREREYLSQELQSALLLMSRPIKHFVNDIIKCSMETSIHDAAQLMTRKRQNVLFIHKDQDIIGVINNSDFKKRAIAENKDLGKPIMEIMSAPVINISENALLYEAVLLLRNKSISHLAVKNEDGLINGAVSFNDIIGTQQNSVSYLIKEIEIAEDIEHLKKVHVRVPALVNALIESGDKTRNITRIITSVSDAITKRVISLAIEGLGKPPCQFAFMVMGSEGRMEQTLTTDQDNAIIIENLPSEGLDKAYTYFQKLGEVVSRYLDMVGYNYCEGEIMAKNPKWTQPLVIWKEYFSNWFTTSNPQSILDASIFFDFRCVFGSETLVNELREHVNGPVESRSVFFYHLAQSVAKYKVPLSLFGNIVSKDERKLDIKKILLPITSFIRLYSLKHKLSETNSLSRIKQLYQQTIISKSTYDELVLSYNYLMEIRFRFQAKSILQNETPNNLIDINELTHIEVATLKKIFGEIGNLQAKVNFDFKGTM